MILIDRHIAFRFLVNFLTLFCLIFIFIVSVDVVLQFDSFVEAASLAVEQERFSSTTVATLMAILDFHGPRVFQSYSFLVGLVSVAAAGFTLSQMQRSRELVAMLAAGIPLQRVAVTIFLMACLLNGLQVFNQEFIVPRLAPVLLREHAQILSKTSTEFPVVMTRDASDNLFSGRVLDADRGVIEDILVLTRDEDGTAERRISAPRAVWNAEGYWVLESGIAIDRVGRDEGSMQSQQVIERFETDLSPHSLMVRRDQERAQMLSTRQIGVLRDDAATTSGRLARIMWTRIGGVGVNLLVLLLILPNFLCRLPGPLLLQSVKCAAIGVPVLMLSVLVMLLPVSGVSPALMALLPTAILIPIAFWRVAALKS